MLGEGIGLSGEGRSFFVQGRLDFLSRMLGQDVRPRRILDFGCGTGDGCRLLASHFPEARVVGADRSRAALEWARKNSPERNIGFVEEQELEGVEPFDLCYVSGVMHHVPVEERNGLLKRLHGLLTAGGACAIFENNPWSPAARLVMRRIVFDRDAVMMWPHVLFAGMIGAGFGEVLRPRFLFFFPRILSALRCTERHLDRIPLGAQYLVLGRAGGKAGVRG